MSVTLTVGQLRALIQHELATALRDKADDRLLTIDDAARIMAVSPDWLYRHAPKLPFARKLAPKMLRFSRLGIEKWLRTRTLC